MCASQNRDASNSIQSHGVNMSTKTFALVLRNTSLAEWMDEMRPAEAQGSPEALAERLDRNLVTAKL